MNERELVMMGETMDGFMEVVVELLMEAVRWEYCGRTRPVREDVGNIEEVGVWGCGFFVRTVWRGVCGMEELMRMLEWVEEEERRGVVVL